MTELAIPTVSSGPTGIAAGPYGAVWFTESNGNKIGRIRTVPTTIPTLSPRMLLLLGLALAGIGLLAMRKGVSPSD